MEKLKRNDPDYQGMHMEKLRSLKKMRKAAVHPVFLYSAKNALDDKWLKRLEQIVNVYEHTYEDFLINGLNMVEHYKASLGDTSSGIFTLGQSIRFRVVKNGPTFDLSLFKFFINYTMLCIPILMGADLSNWTPWCPPHWSSGAWCDQMNKYIKMCRPLGNMRSICECIELAKFIPNIWASEAGDRLSLSISNNDFIELMKRSDDARESLTCTFDIPDNATPAELEDITNKRAKNLLDFTSRQEDLPISVYTRNGLFNPTQFREFAVHITNKPDLVGNTIPYTYPTNTFMGTKDIRAHVVDAAGGRKAEVLKLAVSDAGALERSLSMMMSSVRFVDLDYECDSKHFRTRYIDSVKLLENLDGRVCTLDPESDEYLIIDPDNTELVGKTIYMKTPITCTHPRRKEGYICSACYGKLMANLNCDVHIGRLAAMNSADDIEQKLLSAKHALNTNTRNIVFNDDFYRYFDMDNCCISFSEDMLDASVSDADGFKHLFLEFHPSVMKKRLDGEGRHFDRSTSEIIIYDDRDESRVSIREENGLDLFLSSEFVLNFYLPALRYVDERKDVVQIPFTDLVDTGKPVCDEIFEYEHPNREIADALKQLDRILIKTDRINMFNSYDECLNTLIPLFRQGGINIPELQCEMLISQMIFTKDRQMVDWTQKAPEYEFFTINKSIQNNRSALTSILYQEASKQISGQYGTYEKDGVSAYDWYLLDRSHSNAVATHESSTDED